MKPVKIALRVAGTIFGAVAILHFLRIISGIQVQIGDWEVPLWINWAGLVATAFLCGWLLTLSSGPDS